MFSTTPTTRWCIIEAIVPARSATSGGGLLRGRHDDHLGVGQVLAERDRDVAGAGREVEEQRVEVAPVDVAEHLHQRPVEHRASPGDDLVATGLSIPIEITEMPSLVGTGMIMSSTCVGRTSPTPSMAGTEWP